MAYELAPMVGPAEVLPAAPYTLLAAWDGGSGAAADELGGNAYTLLVDASWDGEGVIPDPGPTCEEIGLAVWSYGDRTLTG